MFEEKIASMKEKQLDGDKGGEKWRTDTMNYLIGRAPDIESLYSSGRNTEVVKTTQGPSTDKR